MHMASSPLFSYNFHQTNSIFISCLEHPLHRTLQDGIVNLYCAKSIEFPATIERDISAITGAKSAISTALEEARGQKLIGSSLQSSVVLSIPSGNPLSTFQNYLNELEAIFVVSSIELGDGKGVVEDRKPEWHFMAEFEVGGQKAEAWVLPPKDHKCPRCWRYVAPVEDELCGRCDEEVKIVEAAKEKAAR
jgi:isoleucyl-tRNA synthetase